MPAQGGAAERDDLAELSVASYPLGLCLAFRVVPRGTVVNKSPSIVRYRIKLQPIVDARWQVRWRRLPAEIQSLVGYTLEVDASGASTRIDTRPGDSESSRPAARIALGDYGRQLEIRLPTRSLAPLPSPLVEKLRYSVVAFAGSDQRPVWQAAGIWRLRPRLRVADAARRRAALRACFAAEPTALWGYEHGWRCSVPHRQARLSSDDGEDAPAIVLSHAVAPDPPRLKWIRERVVLVDLPGPKRGIAALFGRADRLMSLLQLGSLGSHRPKGDLATPRPLRLPDGSWALRVEYFGGRASARMRASASPWVYSAIVRVHGAAHAPSLRGVRSNSQPELREVFRTVVRDAVGLSRRRVVLSRDKRRIKVYDQLNPLRPPWIYEFRGGRYRVAAS